MSEKEMAPAVLSAPRGPVHKEQLIDSTSLALTVRTNRLVRADYEFLGLLNEDFYSLNQAFMGIPPASKKQAISLCEWVVRVARDDAEEAGRALRAWAKKYGKGLYDWRLIEAPEVTYEDNEHLRSIGWL